MSHRENSKDSAQRVVEERRRCKRLPLSYPIEVSGFDRAGQLFREQAVTVDVSDRGCKFSLLRELECGDVVAIRLARQSAVQADNVKPLLFEVVWVEPSNCGWTIGAAKLQSENIWHIAFPSNHRSPTRSR